MIGVYAIINANKDRCYVGSSSNLEKRIIKHFTDLVNHDHHCYPLQEAFIEDGEHFTFSFVATETVEQARKIEQNMLDEDYDELYNLGRYAEYGYDLISYHPRRDQIVNKMTESLKVRFSSYTDEERKRLYGKPGESNPMYGKTHTDEAKRIIADNARGNSWARGCKRSPETRNKLSEIAKKRTGEKNPFHGRHHSESTKERLRQAHLGRKPVNVRPVEIDGVQYESVRAAATELHVSNGTIIHRIKSNNKKFSGYSYVG